MHERYRVLAERRRNLLLDDTDTPLTDALNYVAGDAPEELTEALRPVARGESLDSLETSGYVIHSLQTALHDALYCDDGGRRYRDASKPRR